MTALRTYSNWALQIRVGLEFAEGFPGIQVWRESKGASLLAQNTLRSETLTTDFVFKLIPWKLTDTDTDP